MFDRGRFRHDAVAVFARVAAKRRRDLNKLIIVLVLVLVVAIPIVAGQLLPWWAALLVLLIEIPLILTLAPRFIERFIMWRLVGAFQVKSRVLTGAQVIIHQVSEITAPADLDERETERLADNPHSVRYVQVDFTLTPQIAQAADYTPADLCLVSSDAARSTGGTDENAAFAARVRLVSPNGEESKCDQLCGLAQLRIIFAIPQGLSGAAKFRYYFEQFGEVQLPA